MKFSIKDFFSKCDQICRKLETVDLFTLITLMLETTYLFLLAHRKTERKPYVWSSSSHLGILHEGKCRKWRLDCIFSKQIMFIVRESGKMFPVSSKLKINTTEWQVFLLAQLRLDFLHAIRAVFRVFLWTPFFEMVIFLADIIVKCG